MSSLSRLALLFVGVPLLELVILVQLGQVVGFLPTIGIVLVTGFAGAALARLEGLRVLWTIQGELAQGRLPGGALLDGMAVLVGGALLLTPGILTDLVGLSFLFPPTRKLLLRRIRKSLEKQIKTGTVQFIHQGGFPGGMTGRWGGGSADEGSAPGEIVIDADKEVGE